MNRDTPPKGQGFVDFVTTLQNDLCVTGNCQKIARCVTSILGDLLNEKLQSKLKEKHLFCRPFAKRATFDTLEIQVKKRQQQQQQQQHVTKECSRDPEIKGVVLK